MRERRHGGLVACLLPKGAPSRGRVPPVCEDDPRVTLTTTTWTRAPRAQAPHSSILCNPCALAPPWERPHPRCEARGQHRVCPEQAGVSHTLPDPEFLKRAPGTCSNRTRAPPQGACLEPPRGPHHISLEGTNELPPVPTHGVRGWKPWACAV